MLHRCFGENNFGIVSQTPVAPAPAAQTKFPAVGQMVPAQLMSDITMICGQTHRSSMDFQVGGSPNGTNQWIVNVAPGISFQIWQDISGGKDQPVGQGATFKNGSTVTLQPSNSYGAYSYYIALPQGATSAFYVKLTPGTQTIPPPPPQPAH